MAHDKLDLFQTHKAEYKAQARSALVETAPAVYLAFSGRGAPGGLEFSEAIDALFGMAFTIQAKHKSVRGQNYAVGKLEARWPDFERRINLTLPTKEDWLWQLLLRTPEFVTEADLAPAREIMERRGRAATTDRVERIRLDEGLCVQALHTGPYQLEGPTLDRMRAFATGRDFKPAAAHHEIYLSDPRRVEPARLKTILRISLRPAG